jgi:hypothetical protein
MASREACSLHFVRENNPRRFSVSTKIAERRILVAFIVTSPRTEIFRSAEMIPAAMSRQNLIAP